MVLLSLKTPRVVFSVIRGRPDSVQSMPRKYSIEQFEDDLVSQAFYSIYGSPYVQQAIELVEVVNSDSCHQ